MPLRRLRAALTVIPQEPVCFAGSLLENVDVVGGAKRGYYPTVTLGKKHQLDMIGNLV